MLSKEFIAAVNKFGNTQNFRHYSENRDMFQELEELKEMVKTYQEYPDDVQYTLLSMIVDDIQKRIVAANYRANLVKAGYQIHEIKNIMRGVGYVVD